MNIITKFTFLVVLLISNCQIKKKEVYNIKYKEKDYKIYQASIDSIEATLDQGLSKENARKTVFDNKEKLWKIALLLPISGANSNISKQIIDAAVIAVTESEVKNVRIILFDTKGNEQDSYKATKMALDLKVNAIIGPVFRNEAKGTKKAITENASNVKVFCLSNDVSLAKENFFVFGVSPKTLTFNAFSYIAEQTEKKGMGALLPSTSTGYLVGQSIKKTTKHLNIYFNIVEYYQNNLNLLNKSVNKIKNNLIVQYKIDKNGNLFNDNYRDRNKEDRDKNKEEDKEEIDFALKPLEALYLEGNPNMIVRILSSLQSNQILSQNIQLITTENAINNEVLSYPLSDGMLYVGMNNNNDDDFNVNLSNKLGYQPSKISLLTYDTVKYVTYLMKKKYILNDKIYNENGFTGVTGDFRLTKSGLVQRRLAIYIINRSGAKKIYEFPVFV